MSKHTPGPWSVNSQAGYAGHCVQDANRRSVAAFPSNSTRPEDERNANARLIAAAPDLLDLAKDIAGLDHHYLAQGDKALQQALREWKAAARDAIAKAEGTS